MGKFTEGFSRIARRVRRASAITIDVLFAYPGAGSTQVPETPSFYLVQTSPTSCQQRYITPRSSALISSTGTLMVRNPDRSPSPARTLRSTDELLPDGEITAESFELQITDEEADVEPDQEEFGNNVEEASPTPEPHQATAVSASGNRYERPKLVVIPAVRFGKPLPEPPRVPVRALSQEELKIIRKATFQLIPRKPLAQRMTGGLDYKKALADLNHSFTRVSKADFQLIPRKPLAQRLTGGVAYKKALAELKQRHRGPELPVLPPSHHIRDHSQRQSITIPEHATEAPSSQLPVLWSRSTRSRSLVVRGNTVTFDGAYYTYMHYRWETRQRRYLERVLETWNRKFEEKTTLAQEISDALADLGTFDTKL